MTIPDDGNPFDRLAGESGFTDPLAGTGMPVPAGVDAAALARYCLALGDDALIYSHRLQEWTARLPELEEETAVANIALDLLGQARMLLTRAGGILGRGEDDLAFFRDSREFRNVRLAEHADRDFAELVVRLLLFSAWRLALLEKLAAAPDPGLAAIAAKGVNETAYHRDYAALWVIRLGDGTALSHEKAQTALAALWPLTGELFRPDPDAPFGLDRDDIDPVLDTVLRAATLVRPEAAPLGEVSGRAGRDGVHTEAMGSILAELQSVARAHPGAVW